MRNHSTTLLMTMNPSSRFHVDFQYSMTPRPRCFMTNSTMKTMVKKSSAPDENVTYHFAGSWWEVIISPLLKAMHAMMKLSKCGCSMMLRNSVATSDFLYVSSISLMDRSNSSWVCDVASSAATLRFASCSSRSSSFSSSSTSPRVAQMTEVKSWITTNPPMTTITEV